MMRRKTPSLSLQMTDSQQVAPSNVEWDKFPHWDAEELTSLLNKDHIWPNIAGGWCWHFFQHIHCKPSTVQSSSLSAFLDLNPNLRSATHSNRVKFMFGEARYQNIKLYFWSKTFSCVVNGKWKRRFWSRLLNSGHSLHLSAFLPLRAKHTPRHNQSFWQVNFFIGHNFR